jgi:ribosomal protein S16
VIFSLIRNDCKIETSSLGIKAQLLLRPRRSSGPYAKRRSSPRKNRYFQIYPNKKGTYNPIPTPVYSPATGLKQSTKHIELNVDRIKYWLSVGAQPTSRVAWLLSKAGILPPSPRQRQATGGVSLVDSRDWDVQVVEAGKDGRNCVLGVVGAKDAREIWAEEMQEVKKE